MVNEVLSKQMHVHPLEKGQIAVFKLIDADKNDLSRTDLSGRPLKRQKGWRYPGKSEVYDPFAGRTVTISNKKRATKTKTALGDIVTEMEEPVKFLCTKQAITVKHDEPELYSYLMRLDQNADNPHRNKRVKPVFYLVDPKKKVSKDIEKQQFMLAAMKWVMEEATYTDLKACAEKAMELRSSLQFKTDWKSSESSTGYEILKRELFALAQEDPHTVIKGSTKVDAQVKMQVIDAEQMQVIMFVDGKKIKSAGELQERTWFHNDKDLSTITTLDVGADKYDGLLEFFRNDKKGQVNYEKMVKQLEKVFAPR